MDLFDKEWSLISGYGVGKLARQLDRSRQSLRRWKSERRVPEHLLLQVEQLTGARREFLAPDLFEGFRRIRK